MTRRNEKRNSTQGTGSDDAQAMPSTNRVGGRQADNREPPEGGGYPNICPVLNFDAGAAEKKRDPRLEELREMGLQRVWLTVAEEIGVDALLKMWRILDADLSSVGDDGRLIAPIRSYKTFLRYQRNRYIESLYDMGLEPAEIRKKLQEQLCETISLRHLSFLRSHNKINHGKP